MVASRPERKEVIGTNRSQVQVMEADMKEDVALQMPQDELLLRKVEVGDLNCLWF